MTSAERARRTAEAAEAVRRVVQRPPDAPPVAAFRDLRTPAARAAWRAAGGVDLPNDQTRRGESMTDHHPTPTGAANESEVERGATTWDDVAAGATTWDDVAAGMWLDIAAGAKADAEGGR
jgi:hypothetical protein